MIRQLMWRSFDIVEAGVYRFWIVPFGGLTKYLLLLPGIVMAQEVVTVQLDPVGDSGVSGTATLTSAGDGTQVELDIKGLAPDADARGSMHAGTCAMPSGFFPKRYQRRNAARRGKGSVPHTRAKRLAKGIKMKSKERKSEVEASSMRLSTSAWTMPRLRLVDVVAVFSGGGKVRCVYHN